MRLETDLPGAGGQGGKAAVLRWAPGAMVGVIGGNGEMGRLFSRFFRERGYKVAVADRDAEHTSQEVVNMADVVLFAVPLHQTVDIIRDLIPHTRPDQLLMDLSSLKVAPIKEMLSSTASVVGLHPMFGGRISSFSGQTLVACPVRINPADWTNLRDLFTGQGIRVREISPEAHDRMMSIIQVLFHMTTMLTGRVLRELGVNISETMGYTSPSYRLEINLLGRMFAQNGALYSAITQMNPNTGEIIRHLKDGLESYEKWYQAEDLPSFMRDFDLSAAHLGDFCPKAFEESTAMLTFAVLQGLGTNGT